MITSLIFYVFATILIASALGVVAVKNPVHAVLYLILCFFNASCLFLLMGAEFVAFTLLIVYVGAVAVLFLFVVMMLDIKVKETKQGLSSFLPFAGLVALVLLAQLVVMGLEWKVDPQAISVVENAVDNTRALGQVIYTDFMFPFQISGLVLLVAMIGAIVLTLRQRQDRRRQKAVQQIDRPVSAVLEIKKNPPSHEGVDL